MADNWCWPIIGNLRYSFHWIYLLNFCTVALWLWIHGVPADTGWLVCI